MYRYYTKKHTNETKCLKKNANKTKNRKEINELAKENKNKRKVK